VLSEETKKEKVEVPKKIREKESGEKRIEKDSHIKN